MASLSERPENVNRPYTVRWREGGKMKRQGFRLKSEAKKHLVQAQAIEQDERSGKVATPAQVKARTLDEQWKRFEARRKNEVAQATLDKQRWAYTKWLSPHLGHRNLVSLSHEDLSTVLGKVTESGAGADTRIAVYTTLNMMLDDALGRDGHNCRQSTAGTSKRQREAQPLTDEQLTKLLDALDDKNRLFVDTLASLGLRPHEALALRARDITDGKVTVRSLKRAGAGRNQTRTLPLPKHLAKPLEALSASRDANELIFDIPDWRNWRRRVFTKAAATAGLKNVVPYDLRHTAASKLISGGASPTDVADWLGHDVRTTLSIYSHLFPGRLEELSELLSR